MQRILLQEINAEIYERKGTRSMNIIIETGNTLEPLGNLFGIFFEDINHAADGGLYAELIQNRAFEFSSLDNGAYRPLTAWEKLEADGRMDLFIEDKSPVSRNNPHYLVLNVTTAGEGVGVRNLGFNEGIAIKEGECYEFSCYVRRLQNTHLPIYVALTDASGKELCKEEIIAEKEWEKKECVLKAPVTDNCCRLEITIKGTGRVELDYVSLFPAATFRGRKNGLRKDIAELLADLKPKFMRFPGGCLVHDGSLNPQDRDAMYRWKNTIGPIQERPGRRNNWSYNQTLGLGYYEYFLFCEDIGAEPIPVLPAGYNPHSGQAVPIEEMQPWIEDALDLIEFANGSKETPWGAIRTELGHPQPFNLKYLGIGNEEIGEAFFQRYQLFHQAVKAKHPEIKLINSAGPFCEGGAFRRGWESALENGSELIDEHYYQAPEWFLANHNRYDYNNKGTKVFLGEYASQGNTWNNALSEAAFMIGLEKNVRNVELACYAPMLANLAYVNWKPDLIFYNQQQVYGTANYYVQKLFMNHQGEYRLECNSDETAEVICKEVYPDRLAGAIRLSGKGCRASFNNIRLTNLETKKEFKYEDKVIERGDEPYQLGDITWKEFALEFEVSQTGEGHGMYVELARKDEQHFCSLFTWGRQDLFLKVRTPGGDSHYTHEVFHFEPDRTYQVLIIVKGRQLELRLDNETVLQADCVPFIKESLYYTASKDSGGDIIVKLANASGKVQKGVLKLEGVDKAAGVAYLMEGYPMEAENSLETPEKVVPQEQAVLVKKGTIEYELPGKAFRIYRVTPM